MASEAEELTIDLARPAAARRRGPGITWKILLAMVLVVALGIGLAIFWSSRRADQLIGESARAGFEGAQALFDNIQANRYDKLKRLNAFVAGDSTFFAVVSETDAATLKDDLLTRREALGSDFVYVTDAAGKLMARSDDSQAAGADLAASPLVADALKGKPAAGLVAEGGRLFHAVSLPIGAEGEQLLGVLVSGYAIDDAVAADMRRSTGTEVAFVSAEGGKPSLGAATLKGDAAIAGLLGFAFKPGAATGAPERLDIDAVPYLARVSELKGPGGQALGRLVLLRSIAHDLETFRKLRSSLLLAGLAALGLALGASFLLARRIAGPLRDLSNVAEHVRDGDYAVEVPVQGSDEVGALGEAIRAMVRELKDKADLERYVAELAASGDRPTAGIAGQPTVAPRTAGTSGLAGASTIAAGAEPQKGEILAGRYEILDVLGQGGMGKVYKARDRELDEIVALKTIRKDVLGSTPDALDRFKQEIKLARKATHKNIMRTYDFGDAGGLQYLTMEYVPGYTLRQLVRRTPEVPIGIALRVARQVCTGLFAAHDAGVVHRDVKSQNILIQPNGDIKIMDFGIARPREDTGMTATGAIVGTPEFMSPEQATGQPVDHRSDIYSAGVVLYELFTGKLPFGGSNAVEVAMKHVREQPRPPRELRGDLPPVIEAVVLRMMAKEPAKRFQSFAEVYGALSRVEAPAPAATRAA